MYQQQPVTCGSDALENQHSAYLRSTEQDVVFKQPQNSSPKRKCDSYKKGLRPVRSLKDVRAQNFPRTDFFKTLTADRKR